MIKYLILFLSIGLVRPVLAQTAVTNGLICSYPFTGNTNDAGPNSITLTNNGATATSNKKGTANSAYQFNGSNNSMQAAASATLFSKPNLTISCMLKMSALPASDARVIAIGSASTFWQYVIQSVNPSGKPLLMITSGSSYIAYLESSAALSLNTWYHITSVIDDANDSVRVYVNGALTDKFYFSGSIPTFATDKVLMVGASVGAGGYFNGSIDDINIYNRALSAAEADNLYQYSTTVSVPDSKGVEPQLFSYINANHRLRVEIKDNLNNAGAKVEIYGMDGKLLAISNLDEQNTADFDAAALPQTILLVRVSGKSVIASQRIVNY